MVAWEREAAVSAIPLIEQATHRSGQCNRSYIITLLRTEGSQLFNVWTTSSLLFFTSLYIPQPIVQIYVTSGWLYFSSTYLILVIISTEGAFTLPKTNDNHPNPIHPIPSHPIPSHPIPSNPQSFFNHLNRPWIDLSQPSMTDWLTSLSQYILTKFRQHSD